MITGFRRSLAPLLLVVFAAAAISCQRVPLLAPSGSSITLSASTSALPLSGTTTIVAQVIEPSGTPPHEGTHVSFLTTVGTLEPSETTTDINGRATTTFSAGKASGTATITATSGGVSTGTSGGLKIAIGAAAVGRITVAANPTTVSAQGGTSTITASIADLNGNPLGAVPVTFTTSAGTIGASVVNTDASGNAQTTLTTSVQATVTATAGVSGTGGTTGGGSGTGSGSGTGGSSSGQVSGTVTVNVAAAPTISITPPSGTLTAGSPLNFTLSVTPASGGVTTIRDVRIDFGDGGQADLGAIQGSNLSVQHVYQNTATQSFTVRATVTDSLGFTTSAATVVVVLPQPPLSVSITSTQVASGGNTTVTFTATVTPSSATVASYVWNFGDGSSQTTTNNQVVHTYVTGSGPKTVTVTVTTTTGQTQTGQIVVNP